jgi:NAD(P)H-hydrate epimerase
MKIFTAEQIRKIDAYTIEHEPILSINLMERAAFKCFEWIVSHVIPQRPVKVFVGPGNNGGDGLAIARMLTLAKWKVEVLLLSSPERLSPDALINYKRMADISQATMKLIQCNGVKINPTDLIIDAMFGSGISKPLDGLAAEVAQLINSSGAMVVSIDSPSGLYYGANPSLAQHTIVQANHTLGFQFPKLSFFFAENEKYTGQWHILNINLHPEAIEQQQSVYYYVNQQDVTPFFKIRTKFSHKGNFGHALLVAGSYGMMGAAILALKACLRSGVGLVTLHSIEKGIPVVQASVPEAIANSYSHTHHLSTLPDLSKYSAIGIGPGIGIQPETAQLLPTLLQKATVPLVIDADALNILAANPEWLSFLPKNTILTPHPGEFDRIFGKCTSGYERHERQIKAASSYNVIIILKGVYTSIALPDGRCFFNSTGNPGMATAGSGDVLTGIVLSLLAQGYDPEQAAILAPFLHGKAGDLASLDDSEESLIASDIVNYIGKAFAVLKQKQ